MADGGITLPAETLHRFAADIFVAAGLGPDAAASVAEVLVWANLRGADSHGVQRIARYIELIDLGELDPKGKTEIVKDLPAGLLIDANRGPGAVAMRFAVAEAARKARQSGICLALVRRTTHTAAMGFYTQLAAQLGMAALAGCCSSPNMIYHGARAPGVATSPLTIAVPGGAEGPLVLDMATGVVALGKIAQARRAGKPIPLGWALDAAGGPTTDPDQAALPLPLGGPKGSGLSLMIECIASLIASNPLLADTFEGLPEGSKHRQNAFIILIDIASFCDLDLFKANIFRLVAGLKALPRLDGVDEILMPGERGARESRKRRRAGIHIPPSTWSELGHVARRFGLALPH